jgi:predicted DNA-binding protein (UPF0251 family)
MPRPVRSKKICDPPIMSGFKPFGMHLCEIKNVKLQFDKDESIK